MTRNITHVPSKPSLPRPSLPWGPTSNRRDQQNAATRVPPVPAARAVVDCAVYVDGERLPGRPDFAEALGSVRESGEGFVWLGLHAPDAAQMSTVGLLFALHPLVVEDAVHAHQRPKLEFYDNVVLLVLRSVRYVDHDTVDVANDVVEAGEILVIAGPDFVITVRHGDHTQLSGVRHLLEVKPELLRLGPPAVVHAVTDHVVDRYLEVVTEMQTDVDELEERVFASSTGDLDIDVVYFFKREVLELRRAVAPLAGPMQWASGGPRPGELLGTHDDETLWQNKEIQRQFRDVADHLSAAVDLISEYDERLSSLLDAAATKVSIQQNTDMRKISAWAAMAALPTAVAGIYGMNFDFMPELHWRYSYPVLLIALVCASFVLWRTLHKHDWL
ncbi:MAG: magnesium and cobalt transport protein CorA [Gordonia sp. (in: high G+C Gram-positive bacteria)]